MTTGRNDPCPCGSGKKYKQCCQPKQNVISLEAARAENLFRDLWEKFADFLAGDANNDAVAAGLDYFFASPMPEEEMAEAAELAMDWVAFAYRTPAGTTLCEQYAASGKGLTAQERDLLRSWASARPGFFRVEAVGGRDYQLSRLPDGQLFAVQGDGMSIKRGDLIAAWLLPVLSTYKFGHLVQHLNEEVRTPLMHLVQGEMDLLRRQRPAATWDELYYEHWPRLIDALTVAATDGEGALRIAFPPGPSVLSVGAELVEDQFEWQAVESQIRSAVDFMDEWVGPEEVQGALRLWQDGVRALRPRILGANGWAAAVLYLYMRTVLGDPVTQADLADAFMTSAATVGKHSRALSAALQPVPMDPRYASLMDPHVRMQWQLNALDVLVAEDEVPVLPEGGRALLERALREASRSMTEREDGPIRQAEDLIDQAWEASGSGRTRLAKEALRLWPDAADAYVILGQDAEARGNLREARRLFEAGVQAGERALGPEFFAENVGDFYGILESRPYMRARGSLAAVLWSLGECEAAVTHYEEMLRLNPGDNQGVRYLLASCYLTMGDDVRLGQLLSQMADDASAIMGFTRALWQYRRSGSSKAADKLLAEAVRQNPHVPAYLLGEKRLPKNRPPYIDFGGDLEAQEYAWEYGAGWAATEGALEWLRSRNGQRG